MSKRYFLTNSAAPYTPATKRGTWNDSSSSVARLLGDALAGANTNSQIAETSSTNPYNVLLGRFVSAPIEQSGSLAGSVNFTVGAFESNSAMNAFSRVHIYVIAGDSDTVRGTLLSNSVGSTEFPTTAGSDARTAAISSLTVQAGDRIVCEFGYASQNGSTTNYNARLYYGGSTSNELIAGSSVTTYAGFVEFTDTNGVLNPAISGGDAQVRSSSYANVETGNPSISFPPQMQSTDFLVAFTTSDEDSVSSPGVPAQPPSGQGWVQIGTTKTLTNVGTAQVWGRAAGSSSGSETWTGGGAYSSAVTMLAVVNVDASAAVDAALTWATGSATAAATHTASAVSPSNTNSLLLTTFFTNNQGIADNQSTPTGMVEWSDHNSGTSFWIGQAVYSQELTASGTTGTRVSTTTGNRRWFAGTLALATGVRLIETLTDDFGGGSLNSQWHPAGTPSVSSGRLTVPYNSAIYTGVYSDPVFRLQGSSHHAEVIPPSTFGTATYAYAGITVYDAPFTSLLRMYVDPLENLTWCYAFTGGAQVWGSSFTYNATNHRWLRIREASGTTYFETSPNGSTWTTLYSHATLTQLNGNAVAGDVTADTDGTGVGNAQFDNVNLAPSFVTHDGAAALSASGALTSAALSTRLITAAMSASGALSAAAARVVLPTVSLSATTALVILQEVRTVFGESSLSASGSLDGVLGVGATAGLSASGALAALARNRTFVTEDATAAGAMSAAASQDHAVTADLSASTNLAATATRTHFAEVGFTASSALTGSLARTQSASVALVGLGSLYPDGSQSEFRASGSLTAAPAQGHRVAGDLSAFGALVADASQDFGSGAADLTGTSALVADGRRVHPMQLAGSAAGALAADGRRVHPLAAALGGASGSLGAAGTRVHAARANFTAFGNAQARPSQEVGGSLNVSAYVVDRVTGRLTRLPDFVSITLSPILNESGAVEIVYPANGARFDLLHANVTEDRDVEIEIWLNGRDSTKYRGILMDSSGDDVEELAQWTFTGVLLNHLVTEIVVYPQPLDEKKELSLAAATAGKVIRTVIQQAQARGALAGLTLGFTDTADSNGLPWSQTVTTKFSPGTTGKAVLDRLVSLGLVEWEITASRVLRAYAPETHGVDRTVGSDPLVLRRGRQIPEAPRKHTVRDAATAVLAAGSEGIYATAQDAPALTRRGRRIETFASANNLEEESGVAGFAQTALTNSKTGTMELTQALEFTPGDPRPGAAYDIGDWIFVDVRNVLERLRIKQWTLTISKDGASGTVSLNDLIAERALKFQRQLESLTNGSATVGTSTPDEDTGIPVAPIGVTVQSDPYTGPVGEALVTVQVGWEAVDSNVDGTTATDVSGYNVEYKYDSGITQTDWMPAGSTATEQFTFGNVAQGETIVVRVQTVDRANNVSDWSVPVIHICLTNTTPPEIPSNPTMDNFLGILRIKWDGLTSIGGTPELNLDYVEVHVSTSSAFTADDTTLFGRLNANGELVYSATTYGVTYYARFVAVNTSGLKSAQSGTGSAVPEQVIGSDVFNGAIGSVKLADLAVVSSKIADLAVTNAKIADLSVGKLTAGTFTASMTMSGIIQTAASGNRMLIDNSGWTAYNGSGTVFARLNILNSTFLVTGQYQTAMTGQRIVLNPTGSLQDNIYLYPSAGGDFARIMVRTAPGDGSAAVLIDGGAASGNGRGRLGAYKNEAFISWVTGDTGGDTSAGYSRTAVSAGNNVITCWVQTQFSIDKYSGSTFQSGTRFAFTWSSGTGGALKPTLIGDSQDAGIKFDSGAVAAVKGSGTSYAPMLAASFTVSSSEEVKEQIRDIRAELDPLAVIDSAPAMSWKRVDEVAADGDDAPIRFGPIAEQLPPQMLRTLNPGTGEIVGYDINDGLGLLWGAMNQMRGQQIVSTSAVAVVPSGTLLDENQTIEIPVTWESSPPAVPTGGFATVASVGVTAWIKTGSVTADGCVVVVKNLGPAFEVDVMVASVVGVGLYSPPHILEEVG